MSKKNKKSISTFISVVMLIPIIIALIIIFMFISRIRNETQAIEATNTTQTTQNTERKINSVSDIKNINDITEDMIINQSIGNNIENIKITPIHGETTPLHNGFTESFTSFTGIQYPIIFNVKDSESGHVIIDYVFYYNTSNPYDFNFYIYLLLSDNSLIKLPHNAWGRFEYDLPKGENKLVFVGYEAHGSAEITYNNSEF